MDDVIETFPCSFCLFIRLYYTHRHSTLHSPCLCLVNLCTMFVPTHSSARTAAVARKKKLSTSSSYNVCTCNRFATFVTNSQTWQLCQFQDAQHVCVPVPTINENEITTKWILKTFHLFAEWLRLSSVRGPIHLEWMHSQPPMNICLFCVRLFSWYNAFMASVRPSFRRTQIEKKNCCPFVVVVVAIHTLFRFCLDIVIRWAMSI